MTPRWDRAIGARGLNIRFALLGPLTVTDPAGPQLIVPGPRQRVLLAVLLLHANRPVPADTLAELVWDGQPPARYAVTLRSHVRRLRHTLGPAAAQLLTREPGYLIQLAEADLDVLQFEALCQDAGAALRAADWQAASRAAAQALRLWRAEPLLDVPSQVLRDEFVPRLEQLRLQVLEDRIEADLRLGQHSRLVPQLRDLTAEYPLREHLHAQLMQALAQSGRQAEALRAYQDARRALVEELGIEPGPELRGWQERILAGQAGLVPGPRAPEPSSINAPSPSSTPQPSGASGLSSTPGLSPKPSGARVPATATEAPRMLPAAVPHFAGRAAELRQLTRLLDRHRGGTPDATLISVIHGTAGVGKTTLAVRWAHQVADRFPDGQLYVNLRGFDPAGPPVSPAQALQGFLGALSVPAGQVPGSLEAQAGLYRSLLAGQQVLILIDNARDVSQVRPLLPGGGGCLVLVTSRERLTGLIAAEAAVPITLDVLSVAEARAMLRGRLGADRVLREPAAVDRLIEVTAGLPLGLSVAAARAAQRPSSSLAALAAELEDVQGRLDALDAGDGVTSVRAALSWSYQQLSEPAARMFRLLSLHPGPDVGAAAAASLAGLGSAPASLALDELSRTHLVAESTPGRFTFHDLLRAYAAELAAEQDSAAERQAATHRMLDYYLRSAYAAMLQVYPGTRDPLEFPAPPPGVRPEQPASAQAGLAWLSTEYQVLLAVVSEAAEAGFDQHAQDLPDVLATFLDRRGHVADSAASHQLSLAAAERRDDRPAQARAHRFLGRALIRLGAYQDGYTHLGQAMELFTAEGDRLGQARSHLALAMALQQQGRGADALAHAEQALPLFRSVGHRAGQAVAVTTVGVMHAELGDYRQALAYCAQGLDLNRELGNQDGLAESWANLGEAHLGLGDTAAAIACYQEALRLAGELGHAYYQGWVLTRLGEAQHESGDGPAARQAWQRALAILDELGHPEAARVRARLSQRSAPAERTGES
jgi:DNA-binding SARP family transcriptional activator/tetratricopeptide (TPR) repeat protein